MLVYIDGPCRPIVPAQHQQPPIGPYWGGVTYGTRDMGHRTWDMGHGTRDTGHGTKGDIFAELAYILKKKLALPLSALP